MKFRGQRNPHLDLRVQVFITTYGVEQPLSPKRSQKVCNHSPARFGWGRYRGSGPTQLALTLLLEVTDNKDFVLTCYHDFQWSVISGLPLKGWTLTAEEIRQWIGEWKAASDRFGIP